MSIASLPIEIWQLIADNLTYKIQYYCSLMRTNKQLYSTLYTSLYAHKCKLSASLPQIRATNYTIVDDKHVECNNHRCAKYCNRYVLSYNNNYVYTNTGNLSCFISVINDKFCGKYTEILTYSDVIKIDIVRNYPPCGSPICTWYKN